MKAVKETEKHEEIIYKQITVDEIDKLDLRLNFVQSVNDVLDGIACENKFDSIADGAIAALTGEVRTKIEEIKEILQKKEA